MMIVFVPYRGIYFLYWAQAKRQSWSATSFSSPIGESTFSTAITRIYIVFWRRVFVPYRGIYFLYKAKKIKSLEGIRFRPLSGNLLSLRNTRLSFTSVVICFRPLSGNLLSLPEMNYNTIILKRFRPLSGNLLSLRWCLEMYHRRLLPFSSPIGESTFSTDNKVVLKGKVLFSSPIGESTFSTNPECRNTVLQNAVFVPYRGIYFLYCKRNF